MRDSYTLDKDALFARMNELEIAEVVVAYDGYGDSGEIDSVDAYNHLEDVVELDDDSESFFRQAAETALASQGIDWYNNEGAFGTVTFDAESRVAYIENNARIESYETYNYNF